jgi:tight adherence protein C
MEYAILAFLIVFLLLASGLLLLFYREALGQRLSSVLVRRRGPGMWERFKARQTAEAAAGSAALIRKDAPAREKQRSAIRQRLVFAGYRRDVHVRLFSIAKVAAPPILCGIAFVTGAYHWNPFLVFAGALGVGYLLPDYWLDHRIKARETAIQRGLPDLLDLMVVCLEAGLSIDQATIRSSEEMRPSHPAISEELALVMLEVRAGQSRIAAWRHLTERTKVDAVRMLVTILVQADQFGTGISRTLRVHSDTMRTHRKRKVEELAAKTSVKLIFPLAMFVFPSFFVVVLGPAVIRLAEAFSRGR